MEKMYKEMNSPFKPFFPFFIYLNGLNSLFLFIGSFIQRKQFFPPFPVTVLSFLSYSFPMDVICSDEKLDHQIKYKLRVIFIMYDSVH